MKDRDSELFSYTVGRFLANEATQLQERRHVFSIPGLFQVVAQALECKTDDIVGFKKLDEGGLNRVFLVTLNTGFQLVARIPYSYSFQMNLSYLVASEAATMSFLRAKGLPIPEIYAYSFTSDNPAETEYMLMEYVDGDDLARSWFHLKEDDIEEFMLELTQFESKLMSISFPAGGSIYYTSDLQILCGDEGIPLEDDEQFCIGPDLSAPMWYGRRAQLDVFRGPYEDSQSVLVAAAEKELAYLEKFGSPQRPSGFFGMLHYDDGKQPPSDHAENLRRFILLAPWLPPGDALMNAFRIRQPFPGPSISDIKVYTNSDGKLRILSVLDWQHTAVLPLFLQVGIPDFISHEEDEISQSLVKPQLPDDFGDLPETQQEEEKQLFRRRLAHFHYHIYNAVYNKINLTESTAPLTNFRRRVFIRARASWHGDTIELLRDLVLMVRQYWSQGAECPVTFTEAEELAANERYGELAACVEQERVLRNLVGCGEDTWVPANRYEEAKALSEELKQNLIEFLVESEESDEAIATTRAAIKELWIFDNIDEDE
ncbi:hypothetical protein FB45DRAFT_976157 [Roridomyces roridus]|uniref:Aminoglycoside phosphotransferase domain-containing protein n=1 Tax=Roridomyces roridus TaxID=1738132 RepID=A0AAD7C7C5_9AGAR|nr:hypothetical protein FB45DRAFT_976157 [Roridomyces roridus]